MKEKREIDGKERRESRVDRMKRAMNNPVIGPKMREIISRKVHEKKNKEGGTARCR